MAVGRVHPRDWLELFDDCTPYEWQLLRAREIVLPFGEDRADTRAQIQTSQILAHHSQDQTEIERVHKLASEYYRPNDRPDGEIEVDQAALDKIPKVQR